MYVERLCEAALEGGGAEGGEAFAGQPRAVGAGADAGVLRLAAAGAGAHAGFLAASV